MAKLIKRLIYPALVALFLVGVWVWYFKPEPGSAPTIPGRVDYIIFDGNFMYEAQRNDEPRHYLKIIRDRGLIQEISALFKGNKYRQTNCMCGFSLSLTFVQMPDERATWGFVRNYPFGVIHHWFAIKKILARERDPSFGEKFYSYEIELPDDIPTATVRAVLSDKDWIVLPQGEPEPTREVRSR